MTASDPHAVTQGPHGTAARSDPAGPEPLPERIGRYRIENVLGTGGFGRVYSAFDEQLSRRVAVKVPHRRLIGHTHNAAAYLAEARTVAGLDHPNIVPVYDVGSTAEWPCFIVSKIVEGADLSKRLKQSRLTMIEAAELVLTIANALHYAHKQGLVHRDVKPGNILIDNDGKPHLVDFGLALREQDTEQGESFVGTAAYMSPEQALGEGHRVDGRSDIFSLGVVLYESLVGRRPFADNSRTELLKRIATHDPRPLRQFDEAIPQELDRICLKAMAKRASERYSTAHDLARDLQHFLAEQTANLDSVAADDTRPSTYETAQPTSASTLVGVTDSTTLWTEGQSLKIIPKGLRSFDAHDADFFLELLPGPRDRDGLPDSLRFWKLRIEEPDADNTFAVGLIYGPSGCGKSSLVKAGLLPRLSDDVIPLYVEATPEETESRLLHLIGKRCPELKNDSGLKESIAAVRRGQGVPAGKQILIVIDQFEQWLHTHTDVENQELLLALRQCDGGRVQCILMVRDDFWLAVSRFMRALEVRLVEGQNSAVADLFDPHHARKVLAAFGRAYGKLPERSSDLTSEHLDFLKQAVAGLAEEGKVICVRLALFADMMKGKPWTAAGLEQVGGTTGVGETFLEETFSASTAPPEHRYHQRAARAVLQSMIPETGMDIKGEMKSYDALLEVSGYAQRPGDFEELIRILDSELRLITPTDPEAAHATDTTTSGSDAGQKYFQLTHDYLVHSLREWLTRKQRESRRGRAELQLAERSALWNAKPENRHLPSGTESLRIAVFTDHAKWTQRQAKMMRKAGRVHGIRSAVVLGLLIATAVVGVSVRNSIVAKHDATRIEGLVNSLLKADTSQVPQIIDELRPYREVANVILINKFEAADPASKAKRHLALALLPSDSRHLEFLLEQLQLSDIDEFPTLRDALIPVQGEFNETLWELVQQQDVDDSRRFRLAAALASFAPLDDRWSNVAPFVADYLTGTVSSVYFADWMQQIRPAREQLRGPLLKLLAEDNRSEKQRELVALVLADYLRGDPQRLAQVILLAETRAEFLPLVNELRPDAGLIVDQLAKTLATPASQNTPREIEQHWKRQATAAATLANLGYADRVWPNLTSSADRSLRSHIVHEFRKLGTDHVEIAAKLAAEQDVSIRRTLIQILGVDEEKVIPLALKERIKDQLLVLFCEDPDPGIHSSAAWVLRRWGQPLPELERGEPEPSGIVESNVGRRSSPWWYTNQEDQTLVVVEVSIGKEGAKTPYTIAFGSREVTLAEFRRFRPDHEVDPYIASSDTCPVHNANWYAAAEYCNWLSERAGIPVDQWVYLPNASGEFAEGMTIKKNYRRLSGYRLPTANEWQQVCNLPANAKFHFGEPSSLLTRYGWCVANSEGRSWPVGSLLPNELGVFDMHGNVWEWTQDKGSGPFIPVNDSTHRVLKGGAFNNPPSTIRPLKGLWYLPTNRHIAFGLRPCRTITAAAVDDPSSSVNENASEKPAASSTGQIRR